MGIGAAVVLTASVAASTSAVARPDAFVTKASDATSCAEYADVNGNSGADWACWGDTVTVYGKSPNSTPPAVGTIKLSTIAPSTDGGTITPMVVAGSYVSNVTEPIYASIAGVFYKVPVTVRTHLRNHSADLTMSYTASPPVSVIYSVRIRRDNPGAPDDTVFTYPSAYGSSSATTYDTEYEDAYGDGYSRIPYDGKKYFFDLYSIRMYASGRVLNIVGSVQSDRLVGYKTVPAKFL